MLILIKPLWFSITIYDTFSTGKARFNIISIVLQIARQLQQFKNSVRVSRSEINCLRLSERLPKNVPTPSVCAHALLKISCFLERVVGGKSFRVWTLIGSIRYRPTPTNAEPRTLGFCFRIRLFPSQPKPARETRECLLIFSFSNFLKPVKDSKQYKCEVSVRRKIYEGFFFL